MHPCAHPQFPPRLWILDIPHPCYAGIITIGPHSLTNLIMAIPLLHPHVLYVQLKAEEYPSYTVYLYKRFFPIAGVIAIAAIIAPMLAVFVSPSIPEARAATTYFSADAETGTIVPPWDDIFFDTTVSNSTAIAKNGSRSYKFTNAGGENDAKVIVCSNKSRHVEGYYSMWY